MVSGGDWQPPLRDSVKDLEPYVSPEMDVLRLDTNTNQFERNPVLDRLSDMFQPKFFSEYPDSRGMKLKSVLSALHDVSPSNLSLGHGSDELLDMCAKAMGGPGSSSTSSRS